MARDALWSGPIVDAHQHFWNPIANDHPWLRPDVVIPFRYGDYSAIKRRYLPADYLADAGDHRISETVYVETERNPTMPIDETRYVSRLAERCGLPSAIVAQAWLDRDDVKMVVVGRLPAGAQRSPQAGRASDAGRCRRTAHAHVRRDVATRLCVAGAAGAARSALRPANALVES